MIPCNVWLLTTPEMVLSYSLQGGRVIFITEDDDPRLQFVPNKLKASLLLPPYDVMSLEFDNNLPLAQQKYYEYLSQGEPAEFVAMILSAAMQNIKIGLYFGNELNDLQYPKFFLNYLYNFKGLSVGGENVQPFMVDEMMPVMMADVCGRGYITFEQFLLFMPVNLNIPEFILPALVQYFKPLVEDKTYVGYNQYFKDLILQMKQAGKYLYSPIIEGGIYE